VNATPPKRARLRLESDLYEQLRNRVLRRDNWRCQSCGTVSNLEVHHKCYAANQEMIPSRT
jgi:5-methylcytosine-specific restriction endonuclease McrA